jgi:Zn-dependent protease with chaperone function
MNTTKTFMLMAALTALFMIAGEAMAGRQGMLIALMLALGLNFFAYWNSDKMALAMNRAREVSMPIPVKSATHSSRRRPGIPVEAGHLFQ